jgi:hypothetical protein
VELSFNLHKAQLEIFNSPERFKIVAAGRRFGKSYLSCVQLIIEGLKETNEFGHNLKKTDVWYVAPTFTQGKEIMWRLLKELGEGVITSFHENTATATLINGRRICIKGSDRPDTLRGVPISYVVMDEYATMKAEVWEMIIRPSLSDVQGGALFIGTPAGKNHFYELYKEAQDDTEWAAFHFTSSDNPTLPQSEIGAMTKNMSAAAIRQEVEASFTAQGGGAFSEENIKYGEQPYDGYFYVTVDPAGFQEAKGKITSKLKRLDECAISAVKVGKDGWWVKEVVHGRWGIKETAVRILCVAEQCNAIVIGIEKGSLMYALLPYLQDEMRRRNKYFTIQPVSHGGQKKTERINWALAGRFEQGRITLNKDGDWKAFIDQLLDFPNPMAHDDLIDSLAYIDQISKTSYLSDVVEDDYEPLDSIAGY